MRQFLRYQVSGSVFIIWMVLFYYGRYTSDLQTLYGCVLKDTESFKPALILLLALPVGVIVHQCSVIIKNFGIAKLWCSFSDFPSDERLPSGSKNLDVFIYILDRISNLNSFYYVRIDNGILAPLFAWLIIHFSSDLPIHDIWTVLVVVNGLFLIIYIPRINSELKFYYDKLESLQKEEKKENE